jgi:predicted AAA+ superfamily ATPase
MLPRRQHLSQLLRLLRQFPVVGLIGARQVGKTTLASEVAAHRQEATVFDLEDARDLARLRDPLLALEPLRGLVVIDEVQARPDLFPALRVLADRPRRPARFLVLGSASPDLLRQSSESLAGRIAYHELPGFDLSEVGPDSGKQLWLRGGFPLSFTASDDAASERWRRQFIRTFLERDLRAMGIELSPAALGRFWSMLAHYHGRTWKSSEFARSLGVSDKTARGYLDVLCGTFMARRLPPWFENLAKRHVKSPKVYFTDTGLLHSALGIDSWQELLGHPKAGSSFEGYAISQVVRQLRADAHECYYWALHTGAELDLLVVSGHRRLAFEIKFTDSPEVTPSMLSAIENLGLQQLDVIHAGRETFALTKTVRAVALRRVLEDLRPLR